MRTLILSISAGGGHVKASEAIEAYIKLDDPKNEVKVVDTIKYINPLLDKVVIGSYLKSLKVSQLSLESFTTWQKPEKVLQLLATN